MNETDRSQPPKRMPSGQAADDLLPKSWKIWLLGIVAYTTLSLLDHFGYINLPVLEMFRE